MQTWVNTHLVMPGGTVAHDYGGGVSSHQAGGYQQNTGMALMHAGEFVANADTTRALERLVGGQLTQNNLLGAAGSGGGKQISISVNQSFSGQESNPAAYQAIVYQTITEVIDKAMRQ